MRYLRMAIDFQLCVRLHKRQESFRIKIAEAKIAGVKEEELLTLCQKLYRREKL